MKYNQMGNTGLFVSEICLGTMTFSGENFFGGAIGTLGQKAAPKLVEKSFAAGVNFIDTADGYSQGQSEIMTGQAIRDLGIKRSEIVLATKVFGSHGRRGSMISALARAHMMDAVVAASLDRPEDGSHRLLYQVHHTDHITPVEETMRALDDLVREGAWCALSGASNWTASGSMMKANGIAATARPRAARFETVQAYYSIAGARLMERELGADALRKRKSAAWSGVPWRAATSSGKYRPGSEGEAPEIGEGRAQDVRFSPHRQGPRRQGDHGSAAHRQGAWHFGGAGGAGLGAGQAVCH